MQKTRFHSGSARGDYLFLRFGAWQLNND